MTRKRLSPASTADVLVLSRRRCCICFGLNRDFQIKRGQIAHVDHDSSNDSPDNLAFLCLEHHDQYDSKSSQSKNFTQAEVRAYRDELHGGIAPLLEHQIEAPRPNRVAHAGEFETQERREQREVLIELLSDAHAVASPTWLSRRLGLATKTVQMLLVELSRDGVVRVDRPKGTMRKTYSLATSIENRLLDTFIATLDEPVVTDTRYVRLRPDCLVDALVETASGDAFIVETLLAGERLTNKSVNQRLKCLSAARKALGADASTGVLLIGISDATIRDALDLRRLEGNGIRVQYVDVG